VTVEESPNGRQGPEGADGPLWSALRSKLRIQQVKFLAWLEANSLARSDIDFGPGPRVTANARLARADIKDSKAAQLNPVARSKRFFQAFKDRVDSRFRLVARESGLGDHLMDDVLFNQSLYPEG
jgi:hypothetical protein